MYSDCAIIDSVVYVITHYVCWNKLPEFYVPPLHSRERHNHDIHLY